MNEKKIIVSAARSLTCRDDLNSKWRLLLAENELSRVSLLSMSPVHFLKVTACHLAFSV